MCPSIGRWSGTNPCVGEHITFETAEIRLVIPRSKTAPEGQGAEIGISPGQHASTCPVRALEAWLRESACQAGPVFRRIDRWGSFETRALTRRRCG